MDDRYQDIHIINTRTGKQEEVYRALEIEMIHFKEDSFIVVFTRCSMYGALVFDKKDHKLVID